MIVITLLVFSIPISVGEVSAEGSQAAALYQEGLQLRNDAAKARTLFAQSAAAYDRLWTAGNQSPKMARDMAQAYLLAGDLANASRSYHRGLRVDPDNRDLQMGLAYARAQVAYSANSNLAQSCQRRDRHFLLLYLSTDRWHAIAATLYCFGWLALARAWITRRPSCWTAGAVLLLSSVIIVGWLWRETLILSNEYHEPIAIVAEDGTPLLKGNGEEYPKRLDDPLPAGVEMRIVAERGGWLQVQLAGGEIGWISKQSVVMVD